MNKIRYYLACATAIIAIAGCKKNETQNPLLPSPVPLSAEEMLIEKPWKLISYGYDNNTNGMIEANEESIRDCDKDNTYTFNKDGSGVFNENSKICDGNDPINRFNWTLTENDAVLDFYLGKANIVKLSNESLWISNSNSDPVKLMFIYGH